MRLVGKEGQTRLFTDGVLLRANCEKSSLTLFSPHEPPAYDDAAA